MFTVKITPNDRGNPPGKLADVEVHSTDPVCPACLGDRELRIAETGPLAGALGICAICDGHGVLVGVNPLAGLKLIGFSIWERRGGLGRNVSGAAARQTPGVARTGRSAPQQSTGVRLRHER